MQHVVTRIFTPRVMVGNRVGSVTVSAGTWHWKSLSSGQTPSSQQLSTPSSSPSRAIQGNKESNGRSIVTKSPLQSTGTPSGKDKSTDADGGNTPFALNIPHLQLLPRQLLLVKGPVGAGKCVRDMININKYE